MSSERMLVRRKLRARPGICQKPLDVKPEKTKILKRHLLEFLLAKRIQILVASFTLLCGFGCFSGQVEN